MARLSTIFNFRASCYTFFAVVCEIVW